MSTSEFVAAEFVPGQRWVSNTEPELGLGVVIEVEGRRVALAFPAAEETRTYASGNTPLSRVQYRVGDRISDGENHSYKVVDLIDRDGFLIYQGEDDEGLKQIIPENDLNSFVQFSSPKDRLFSGQIDKHSHYTLRLETQDYYGRLNTSSARGLLGGRVQLLPHQLYIAHEVANRWAPRVLLADEVGLGKTIEAGLILHQQLVTGRASRVLIAVPDSLLHQWLVEMLRRFNLRFTILDDERCSALEADSGDDGMGFDDEESPDFNDVNPFDTAQLVLCSLSFLTENPDRQVQAMSCDWDLLIVDEAHHLEWSEASPSPEYQCVEELAGIASGLLLLTATPEQLGRASHFARLRLLDPDRYHSLEAFEAEEAEYKPVNEVVRDLLAADTAAGLLADDELLQRLAGYAGDEAVAMLRTQCQEEGADVQRSVQRSIRELLDRHGTGRVLLRNTRSSVAGFPERKLHAHSLEEPALYKTIVGAGEASVDECLRPELLLGHNWTDSDSRVHWLIEFLKQHRNEKVLVICALAESARALENKLRMGEGIRAAVFDESMSLVERDRAAAYFADSEAGAQVLLCSEIGSEGRNFQFAQNLVLFDLPLSPDLLEQRIGRLDRIGQQGDVQIHVPHFENGAQADLLRWYRDGVGAFNRPFPAGRDVEREFGDELRAVLTSNSSADDLISRTHDYVNATLTRLQQGRDALIELNSCNAEAADDVVEAVEDAEREALLADYMERCFDQFGVDHEPHSEGALIIRPSDHMRGHHFPALPEDGLSATYNRELALSSEDLQYLTWEHPMVSGVMDMVVNGEFGNTTLSKLKLKGLAPGTILVECLFVLSCPGPKYLQLPRYLPKLPLRILVDSADRNIGELLTAAHLNRLGEKVPRRMAQDLVRAARPQLEPLIDKATAQATSQQSDLIAEAVSSMRELQQPEVDRLEALAAVNPNIRAAEVDQRKNELAQLEQYLSSSQLLMDGIRVVIAT